MGQACGQKDADARPNFLAGQDWDGRSLQRCGPTRDDCRTTHVGPDQTAWIRTRGMAESNVREIRGKSPGKLGKP